MGAQKMSIKKKNCEQSFWYVKIILWYLLIWWKFKQEEEAREKESMECLTFICSIMKIVYGIWKVKNSCNRNFSVFKSCAKIFYSFSFHYSSLLGNKLWEEKKYRIKKLHQTFHSIKLHKSHFGKLLDQKRNKCRFFCYFFSSIVKCNKKFSRG